MILRHRPLTYSSLRTYNRLKSGTTTIVTSENLPAPAYNPEFVEKNTYSKWEESGRFKARDDSDKPSFSMVLPPPNVTGKLHLGHALACTVQDVIVRRNRSLGKNVLWLPGVDHAGIATQGVVEKYLKTKLNINRQDLGRENFNKEVLKWKEKHGNIINQQLKTLGCSLDWSREIFTMDPKHNRAVNTAFIKLFKKGLIYRKKGLVNWCVALKSTVSDIEVESMTVENPMERFVPGYNERVKFGFLYSFAYKVYDSAEEIVVSTTLPETMLGDTAVAVHPDDHRYTHLQGKKVIHPFTNTAIPIITDNFVDMKFGTGAVKITPAHSKTDYDVAKRHNLPLLQVINENGTIENGGEFNGLNKYQCRTRIVEKLSELGLLKSVVPHSMTLPVCSRTGAVIDHLPKEQWFLSCSELNKKATELVKTGKLQFEPDKFVKNWLDWTEDDRDWCISRQLWWGHQIPAYQCSYEENSVWIAAENDDTAKEEAAKLLKTSTNNIAVVRDSDVLDTWFSAGIYPFSSLGWPEKTLDYKKFYPLSLMATGHDILGFWVHRMVMLGLELTGRSPFNKVLLHGIICDSKGAKMSKSKGNVIDPIDVINGISLEDMSKKCAGMKNDGILSSDEVKRALSYNKAQFSQTNGIPECGVDALRFTLLTQDVKSHFVNFDVYQCHANKLFCNKIWQSIKYLQLSLGKLRETDVEITRNDLTFFDQWILSKLASMVKDVNNSLDNYDFHIATKALRNHIYHEFCDVYLESTKPGFEGNCIKTAYAHAHTLSAVLNTSLRCLSPIMIYLTTELIPKIPSFESNIIHNFQDATKEYFDIPKTLDFEIFKNKYIEERVEKTINAIALVRQLKGFYGVSSKLRPKLYVNTNNNVLKSDLKDQETVLLNLTKCESIQFDNVNSKNCINGKLDKHTTISLELVGDNVENIISSAKSKLENKIKKLEENLLRYEERVSGKRHKGSQEWMKVSEVEKVALKKEELDLLKRLIVS